MRNFNWVHKVADDDDDNVNIISSAWCKNRSGVCLSFAITIDVMDIDEIDEFGKMFMDAVNESYGSLLETYFVAKSEKPLICATDDGELIMLWSFQADGDKAVIEELRGNKIKEIK